ncbi:aldose 1-epimerase family protein [Dyadobacter tibetensis]|uniref:aldose 1-epimerase family protein n=1 Tax=Dyadobacter tibetensis TaxID=1211851 RepID=UPI0004725EBB|nr:aldose 1-epimerase family protein [Dyadobacter tibetensis]
MKQTIQNEHLKISILDKGAELCEIKSKINDLEYIWHAEPSVWGSSAPVLFPAIGAVKEGVVYYKGQPFHLPRHGFIRNNEKMQLIEKTETKVTYCLKQDKATLEVYPFAFEFYISFILDGNSLQVHHRIINPDEEPLYFSLGGHPAFTCPFYENEKYEDYYLEFDEIETDVTWLLDEKGLVRPQTRPVLNQTSVLPLSHELFRTDALIFKNLKSKGVSLKSRRNATCVRMDFTDFPYLGIWAKPEGDFVCIEPWLGIADSTEADQQLENKEGMVQLEGGSTYQAAYTITIIE